VVHRANHHAPRGDDISSDVSADARHSASPALFAQKSLSFSKINAQSKLVQNNFF
jgi:hypothetical protein